MTKRRQLEDTASEATKEYRDTLQRLAEQSQSEYDKAVMTLSGGALGISFGYLKDIAGPPPHAHLWLLVCAWLSWTVSVIACLYSLASSARALRQAIEDLDLDKTDERPGGAWDHLTHWLNRTGGACFALGTVFMIFFAAFNQNEQHPATPQPIPTSSTSTAPAGGTAPAATEPRPYGATASAQPVQTNSKVAIDHVTSQSSLATTPGTPTPAEPAGHRAAGPETSAPIGSQNKVTPKP